MARVLLVGYEPETVDFSNPALPTDMDAEKIRAGLALALKQMTERGWEADLCLVGPDETAGFSLPPVPGFSLDPGDGTTPVQTDGSGHIDHTYLGSGSHGRLTRTVPP